MTEGREGDEERPAPRRTTVSLLAKTGASAYPRAHVGHGMSAQRHIDDSRKE